MLSLLALSCGGKNLKVGSVLVEATQENMKLNDAIAVAYANMVTGGVC